MDAAGIVYATGDFVGTATFPMGEVLWELERDGFLLKLNPALAAIHGEVFNDLDNDGVDDDGAGVNGFTVGNVRGPKRQRHA